MSWIKFSFKKLKEFALALWPLFIETASNILFLHYSNIEQNCQHGASSRWLESTSSIIDISVKILTLHRVMVILINLTLVLVTYSHIHFVPAQKLNISQPRLYATKGSFSTIRADIWQPPFLVELFLESSIKEAQILMFMVKNIEIYFLATQRISKILAKGSTRNIMSSLNRGKIES